MRETRSAEAEDYVRRLDLLLGRADPEVRQDVMAGVVEHLQEAERTGPGAVREEIRRLGSPEEVAAAALGDVAATRPGRTADRIGAWASSILVTGATGVLGLLAAGLALTAHFDDDAEWNLSPLLAFLVAIAALTAAVVGLVLVWVNRAWPRRARRALTLVTGASLAVLLLVYPLALALPAGWGFLLAPLCIVATALLIAVLARETVRALLA